MNSPGEARIEVLAKAPSVARGGRQIRISWPHRGVSANRCSTIATLLADGRVLIAGAYDCSSGALDTAEVYDPLTGQCTPTGKLAIAQSFSATALLTDGRVLLVGGIVSEVYDPKTGTCNFGPHTVSPESGQTATLLPDGSVLTTGDDADLQMSRAQCLTESTVCLAGLHQRVSLAMVASCMKEVPS
jgi:hypothetical protein